MNYNEDGLFYVFLLVRLFQMISICFNVYRSVLSLFADRKSIRFLGEEWKEGTLSNVEIEEKIMRSWDVSHVEDNLDSWIWRVFWIVKTVSFFFVYLRPLKISIGQRLVVVGLFNVVWDCTTGTQSMCISQRSPTYIPPGKEWKTH